MANTNEFFVRNLKRLRKEKKMNQSDVAELIGVNVTTYQKYEYGAAFPRQGKLDALAKAFGVSVSDLMSERKNSRSGSNNVNLISSIIGKLATLNDGELRLVDGFIDDLADLAASGFDSSDRSDVG